MTQRLTGRWVGSYTYDRTDIPGPREVGFSLVLFESPSWRVAGEVQDDPAVGVETVAIVTGWSWRRRVWFKKIMPSLHIAQDPKPIMLEDYLEAQYGERIVRNPVAHVISYRGIIASDCERVEGTWHFPHYRFVLESKRVVVFPASRGTWKMRRP